MTDYKLLPVEPTAEMVEAACDEEQRPLPMWSRMKAIYTAMLAAAPAVQGEPVYLYRRLGLNDFVTCDFTRYTELSGKPNFFETKILYTAPQPPLQLPDLATYPNDSDEGASLWDHGYKRGWNACLGAAADILQPAEQQSIKPDLARNAANHLTNWLEMDICECEGGHYCGYNEVKRTRDALLEAAEQQPAPYVAGLAGKMGRLIAAGNRLNAEAEECTYDDGMAEVAGSEYWCEFRDALEAATEALAALRKQGGEE